jgi:signal transduction histidine kinase
MLPRITSSPQREPAGARSDDLAVICHELRNSLTIVRGAARLLRSPGSTEMNTAGLVIERQVGHMSRHVDDLLEPLRRSRQEQGLLLSQVDLRVIVRHALNAIAADMAGRGHRLVTGIPAEPIWLRADAARLEQAFSNLLINAAKYTPDGGDIALSIEADGEIVRVRVRDSGIGIPPALLLRVFGMFVHGDVTPAGAARGHGIGLAVVRAVVEMHGGTVSAASEGAGRGSEFTVTLPVASAPANPAIATL